MPCGAIQDGWVMVERSDRMWSTGEENGKPLQYSCLENPMNSMKRQKDRTLNDELPRLVGAQYATGKEWRNNSRKNDVKLLSRVRLFGIPWTVAYQAPPSMGFSRQEYWSGLPFPSAGDLPDPGFEPGSPVLQADALPCEQPGKSLQCVSQIHYS